jgi:hypothetical protein
MTASYIAADQGMPKPVAPAGYLYTLSSVPDPNTCPTLGKRIAAYVLSRDTDYWVSPNPAKFAPGALEQLRKNGGSVGGLQVALARPQNPDTTPAAGLRKP